MNRNACLCGRVGGVLAVLALTVPPAIAATKTWNNAGTDYNTAGNWTGGLPGSADTATFTGAANPSFQPNVSASITNTAVLFSGDTAAGYTLSSSGSAQLSLGGATYAIRSENTSGTNTISANVVLTRAGNTVQDLYVQTNGGVVISGNVSESGGSKEFRIRRVGTATGWSVTLSGSNSFSGGFSIFSAGSGRLNINSPYALGTNRLYVQNSSANCVIDNTTGLPLALANNSILIDPNTTFACSSDLDFGAGVMTVASAGKIVTVSANTLSIGGVGAANAFTKRGSGTLAVNGTISDGVTFENGTLAIGHNSAVAAGLITMEGGTILAAGSARSIANNVDLQVATVGGTNDLTLNGNFTQSGNNRTLTVNNSGNTVLGGSVYLSEAAGSGRTLTIAGSGALTVDGVLANYNGAGTAGSITLNNTGTLTLNNANTYNGATTLTAGNLILGNKAALGTSTVGWNGVTVSASTDLTEANAVANVSTYGGDNTFAGANSIEFSGPWSVVNHLKYITNNIAGGALIFSGPLHLSQNASNWKLNLAGSGATVISGTVDNGPGGATAPSMDFYGPGSLTLSGNSTFNAGLTLHGGQVNINNGGSSSANSAIGTGTLTINGGSIDNTSLADVTLLPNNLQNWDGDFTYVGSVHNLNLGTGAVALGANRQVTVSANTLTVGGVISGGGRSLTKAGNGALTLSGNNTFSGGLILSAGRLNINSAGSGGFSPIGTFGLTIQGGTSIDNTSGDALTLLRSVPEAWDGDFTFVGSSSLGLGGGAITLGGNRVVTVQASTLTVGGIISGGYGITKAGAGTLALNGNNFFTGGATINAGTVRLGNAGALNSATPNAVTMGGGTLALNGYNVTMSDLSGSGTVENDNASAVTLTINKATGASTVSALLQDGAAGGALGLAKSGAGTLTLNSANNHSGGTTVSAGTLAIGHNSALGSGSFTLGGGTAQASGGARVVGNTTILSASTAVAGSDSLTFNSSFTQNGVSGTLTVNNSGGTVLAGDVFLSESAGTGRTLTIGGSGGLTVDGVLANYNGSGTAGNLTVNGTGTLTLNNANTYSGLTTLTAGNLVLGHKAAFGASSVRWDDVNASASLDLVGANAIANHTTNYGHRTFAGNHSIEFSGSWTWGGTYATSNKITGGTLTFSGPVHLSQSASALTVTMAGSGNTVISGDIDNGALATAAKLTLTGPGTLTVLGNNTYGGATTINGGTLFVDGSGATSLTTVASGGTLAGTGVLKGPVSVSANGSVTPGPSVGTLTVSNNYTQNASGILNVELGAAPSCDLLSISGSASLSGTLNVTNAGGAISAGSAYTVLVSSALSGTFAVTSLPALADGLSWSVSYADDKVVLSVTAGNGPTFWWDADGAGSSYGGSGKWDTTAALWHMPSSNSALTAWNNSVDFHALFTGSGGIVTNTTSIQLNRMTFMASGYTITNGTITMAGSSSATIAASNGVGVTIASQLSGTNTVVVSAPGGVVTLSGANDFTGFLIVSNGTLKLGSSAAAGTADRSMLVRDGATVDLNGQTIGEGIGDISNDGIFGTGVGGLGALVNSGASLATVTNSTFSSGSFTVGGSGDIHLGTVKRRAAGSYTLTKIGSGTLTISNSIANDDYSMSANEGTLVLAAAVGGGNNYSADSLAINGGTVRMGSAGGNNQNVNNAATVTINSGLLDLNGYGEAVAALAGMGGTITSAVAATVSVGSGNGSGSYGGAIVGSVALTKVGIGTQTLSGNSTYTGATAINGGTLAVDGTVAGSTVTVNGSGTLAGTGSVKIAILQGGILQPGGAAVGVLSAANSMTINSGAFRWNVTNASGTAGIGWDLLRVGGGSGTLDLSGAAGGSITVRIECALASLPGFEYANAVSWKVIDAGSVSAFSGSKFTVDGSGFVPGVEGGTWAITNSAGGVFLSFSPGSPVDLAVRVVAAPDPVPVDDTITYTITVTNQSSVAADVYYITNRLAANTAYLGSSDGGSHSGGVVKWTLSNLAGHSSRAVTLTARSPVPGPVTAVSEVWPRRPESNAADNRTTNTTSAFCPSAGTAWNNAPATRTGTNGFSLSFTVTSTNSECNAPFLRAGGLPSGSTFVTTTNGYSVSGLFSWPFPVTGTHPVRFYSYNETKATATVVTVIYISNGSEGNNSAGIPVSQTNWHVTITNIQVPSSGNVTVVWDSVEGVTYDVYQSDNNLGGAMSWSKVVSGTEADGDFEQAALSATVSQRFFQVVLAGGSPSSNGVWAVIRPTINAASVTLVSPGTAGDRKFNGELGTNLAKVLSGDETGPNDPSGDEVLILNANQSWRTLWLNSAGVWMEGGSPSTYELATGQGFYVLRNTGSSAQPRLTGPVGNTGIATNTLADNSGNGGWNIVTFSQGKHLSLATAFGNPAQGSPEGNWDETQADLIVMQTGPTSWKRIMRTGDNTWLDLSTFSTANITFGPGSAVFYYRQPVGDMKLRF